MNKNSDNDDGTREDNLKINVQVQYWSELKRYLLITEGGSLQIEIYPDPRGEQGVRAFMYALWVDEKYRRKGIATRLIEKAESIVADERIRSVFLEWNPRDADREILEWYIRRDYYEVEFGKNGCLLKKYLQYE